MSILSSKGISIPTFQPASGKGNDSQGNGSGGMYFGQGQEEPDHDWNFFNDYYPDDDDEKGLPYNVLLSGPVPDAMKRWKTILAVALYQKVLRDKQTEAMAN